MLREEETKVGQLSSAAIRSHALHVRNLLINTKLACRNAKAVLAFYFIYAVFVVFQLTIGLIQIISTDEDEARLLIPVWLPCVFVFICVIFAASVSSLGAINLRVKDLLQLVARMHFNLRINIMDEDLENYEEKKDSADVLLALLKIEPNVANLFGAPITPKLMTTMWSEIVIGAIILTQFLVTRTGDRKLITLYFCPTLVEAGNQE